MTSFLSEYMSKAALRLALGAALLAGASLRAQTHEAIFSGTLHTFSPGVLSAMDGSVTYGTPFSVIFRYDANATAFFTDGSVRTGYEATTLPSYSVVTFGNYSFTNTGFRSFVVNDYDLPYDGFSLRSTTATSTADDGFRIVSNGLIAQLYTSNTATYTSTSLNNLTLGTAIGDFDVSSVNDLTVVLGYGSGFSTVGTAYGSVTSYSVTAIPEPSTYAMLAGLGALGLVAWRRRSHRSSRAV